jgi:uncharacterized protein YjbI with pentapeptide repeats
MAKTVFDECLIKEAFFSETDLSGAVFNNCNMAGTSFNKVTLTGADFRTAFNYFMDPENNRIKNARFSILGVLGLLYKYGIRVE